GGEHDEPGCDELDCERQSVETTADLAHRLERIWLEHDATRGRELDEEGRRILERQRLERKNAFGRESERHATGREDLEIRGMVEQFGHVNPGGRGGVRSEERR